MNKYPTLSDMDISRFDEIREYSLYSERDTDVLKIYYKRKEGSLLPRRKVFKFPKRSRPFADTIDNQNSQQLREPSPALIKAVEELHALLKGKKDSIDHKAQILRRLDQLETEVKSNTTEIRSLLEKL